ncbi:M50 family metallopeptidase [Rubripirellula reticaptiva]|uniref:Metalloprotease MmpA n=1 Tax=Rubripirellula reticaptiva TaxID=2528013 RepID=A0A5C6F8U6_9BACT|nr:M50 family metallopeptidase [Rubripirellula reticaptiva]TWU57818.1 Metalloprotease MmpA [Rubripirellula reticaptiva]
MLIDSIAAAIPIFDAIALAASLPIADLSLVDLPLAATDDPGFVSSLLTNIMLWGRVALGIGLVIFVHELGHFVAAKSFGVKCEKFYVGFDVPIKIGPIKFPRTLGKFTYGETEYGIGIIPLGGYVKMLGQDDDPRKLEEENKRITVDSDTAEEPVLDPRSFPAKPVWQRMIIISAGVVVNVITGILFAAMAFGYGVTYSPAIVGGVTPGGPAWQAGIEPGGKVLSIGTLHDDNMHFREMKMEILTQGFEKPDQPIDVAIQYDDGVRNFKLQPKGLPDNKEFRMIGVAIPESVTLDTKSYARPQSVAAEAFTEADAGATITAFGDTAIDDSSIVPGTNFFDYLYTHPSESIELTLTRADEAKTVTKVTLPPQKAKSIGIRYAVGPIVALVDGGPADKAGLKVGDMIEAVADNESVDAYSLPNQLVGSTEPLTFRVRRGQDDAAETVSITITPNDSLQTLSPTAVLSGDIGVNSFGFAYKPLPTVSRVLDEQSTDGEALQPGDQLQEVRLVMDDADMPEWLKDERYAPVLESLREGQEFTSTTPLNAFVDTIQYLPIGAKLEVKATRGTDNKIVSSTLAIQEDDRYLFDRGLGLPPREAVQQADSIGQALSLGFREGQRRFKDVVRFLKMLPQGRIGLKHVGGPLAIVDIAKNEAEKGISPQLMFLTMLSMNLAILNFLPIPALDGGHMMFLLYELVVGKRANEQLEFRLTIIGLLSLLTLMVVVFANDLFRYLN